LRKAGEPKERWTLEHKGGCPRLITRITSGSVYGTARGRRDTMDNQTAYTVALTKLQV